MKLILLIFVLSPVFAIGQNKNDGKDQTFFVTDTIREINIVNVLGQTIFTQVYDGEKVKIDIPELAKGIYAIKINGLVVGKYVCRGEIHFIAYRSEPIFYFD